MVYIQDVVAIWGYLSLYVVICRYMWLKVVIGPCIESGLKVRLRCEHEKSCKMVGGIVAKALKCATGPLEGNQKFLKPVKNNQKHARSRHLDPNLPTCSACARGFSFFVVASAFFANPFRFRFFRLVFASTFFALTAFSPRFRVVS